MLLCARSAKRPKPPNGTSLLLVQRSASRSDGDSMVSVPSRASVGWSLPAPSNATLIGAPDSRSFTPERSPVSAAKKSPSVSDASIGSSCQTKWPLAPKLREIDGQASWKSTPSSRSVSSLPP